MIINCIYSLAASIAFGILFNIPPKYLFFAGIGGGLGWFFYELPLNLGVSTLTALYIGSIVLSIYGEIAARILKCPVTVFVICALIPLVPGSGMYNTLLASLEGDINKSLEVGLTTLLSAGSIAIGILTISTMSKFITYLIKKRK